MLLRDQQLATEYRYSKRRISEVVRKDLSQDKEIMARVNQAISYINEYMVKEYSYASKNERVKQLISMDVEEAVMRVLEVMCVLDRTITYTNLVGQTCGVLPFPEKLDAIKTISEIIALMARAELVSLYAAADTNSGMMEVEPVFTCSQSVLLYVDQTKYLPPMVTQPRTLHNNKDSAYLTIKEESLILKSGNHHGGDICLDSLNRFNAVELSLDLDMLSTYDEDPTYLLDTEKKKEQFDKMQRESYQVYADLVQAGNVFHLAHKYDKRGRTYAQGYHVSTQGNKFKKAIINFTEKEVIGGF